MGQDNERVLPGINMGPGTYVSVVAYTYLSCYKINVDDGVKERQSCAI